MTSSHTISRHDTVTIAGAGPAGLAAAIVLARGGRRVVVREWKDTVGHRFHDDFQGLENWSTETDCLDELAQAGITPEFDHTPSRHTTAFDAHGHAHQIRTTRPLYYLLRRGPRDGSLDRGLLAQAIAEGVEVRFNDRVRQTGGATILATGPRRADVIASGVLFDTDHADGSWFSLDRKLAPDGYAYLLIHNGRGTLASCMFSDFAHQAFHVDRAQSFFTRQLGLRMYNITKFGGYGVSPATTRPAQGTRPVIGEQAGFQGALAGFGLRYAMRSGILAARCLLDAQDYGAALRREILPQIKTGIANRMLFETLGGPLHGWALRGMTARGADPITHLRRLYAPRGLTRLAYPLAVLRNRKDRTQQTPR